MTWIDYLYICLSCLVAAIALYEARQAHVRMDNQKSTQMSEISADDWRTSPYFRELEHRLQILEQANADRNKAETDKFKAQVLKTKSANNATVKPKAKRPKRKRGGDGKK